MKNTRKNFWDQEYRDPIHLKLSTEPAEDLLLFVKWAERNAEWYPFPKHGTVLDLGCGNGRNLVWLCKEANMNGVGYDSSGEAVAQAQKAATAAGAHVQCIKRSIAGNFDLPDASVDVILDMMTSHVLNEAERTHWKNEMFRVLKPYGWVFFKTFFLDGDLNASRMLREFPTKESGSYMHPRIGVLEHVWSQEEIHEFFDELFTVHKVVKSHKHILKGKAFKRRTISIYLEKKG